jgi:hypothetical protein
MKDKKQENPNHHMGKQSGYELIGGEYYVAPMYQEQFEKLGIKQESINTLLKMVSAHCAAILEEIGEAQKRVWDSIEDDIGLDKGKLWVYDYRRGVVKEAPQKESQDAK